MTFDMASFLLGILTFAAVCWVGYQIVAIAELRIKEKDEWNTVLSNSSPSQTYWGTQLTETTPETYDDAESIIIRPPSRPARPL